MLGTVLNVRPSGHRYEDDMYIDMYIPYTRGGMYIA